MKFLAIKNFERFQHYKDRAPLWIKMHTSVLSDFALLSLNEAAQAQLFKLWVLASRMDNRIPNDRKFISAQIFSKKLYLAELIAAGFVVETDEASTPIRANWSSRYVPDDVRSRVLASTGGLCAACGSSENIEIDHIVPISKGGTGDESNLQPLCRKCNRKKRARTATAENEATQTYAGAEPREETETEREEEVESSLHHHSAAEAEVEAGLAVLLESDADRNALTVVAARAKDRFACLTALASMLTGNDPATPTPTARVFGQALRDMATNGAQPTAKLFRGYLRDAARVSSPVEPSGAGAAAVAGARRGKLNDTGRATLLVGQIKQLVRETRVPGQSTYRSIHKADVMALGADVFEAYESIGGSDRWLATDGSHMSFLIRDFARALDATEAAHVGAA